MSFDNNNIKNSYENNYH